MIFHGANHLYFFPLYKFFIPPHFEYSISSPHPTLSRDAEVLDKAQKLALKFMKGLRHVPYEAALQQLGLPSLPHRRIRVAIFMFEITHGIL